MKPNPTSPPTLPAPTKRRFSGPRVVGAGFLIIILITGFVMIRIVQTSGPGPDPSEIPERPR